MLRPALVRTAVAAVAVLAVALPLPSAVATGTASVTGAVFDDADRDGVRDAQETPFSGQYVTLSDAAGRSVASTQVTADGRYAFSGLADGTYTVRLRSTDWWALRADWVPTTTGSLSPSRTASVQGTTVLDLGLRRIVRSTDADRPLSEHRGPTGLLVRSYNDAVTASQVHGALAQGQLLGPEAATTAVYFDLSTHTQATTSVDGAPGSYSGFRASVWLAWLSWLETLDGVLFHEYGHVWGYYNLNVVQQTDSFSGYLRARGVEGDARVGTSKHWDPSEMLAEDYRQLFGSATAAAVPQANTDLPPAAAVPGLREWLRDTFTTSPAGSPDAGTPPPAEEPPAETVVVSGLAVSPLPVVREGTVGFSLSAPATTDVVITDAKGVTVRRLLTAAARPAGTAAVVWDRKDGSGRKVRSGGYRAVVTALGPDGRAVTAVQPFDVR